MEKLGYKERLSLSDALWFTSCFIPRMRAEEEVNFSPTCRQSTSIPSLLSSSFLRKGFLTSRDLILAAVVTSKPEDQHTARRLALEILFGEEEREEAGEIVPDIVKTQQRPEGVSGGDQLFLEWLEKLRLDRDFLFKLKAMADEIQLWSDSKCDFNLLTREEVGPLEGEKLTTFCRGDDTELIDFEESLENLLAQGKEPALLRYEDLIIRQRRGQRKAVVILQDVSASMRHALRYSKIYGAILLYALQKHELAFAFFESNDYVIKQFFDKVPIEEAIASMLAAGTKMGTMGEYALRWARQQFGKIDGRYHERECIILSDLGFDDIEEVAAEIKRLTQMDVRVSIILPPAYIYRSCLDAVKNLHCSIVEMDAGKMESFISAALLPAAFQ